MLLTLALGALVLAHPTPASAPPDTLTVADVQASYGAMFHVDTVVITDTVRYGLSVSPERAPRWAAEFLRTYRPFLTYVLTHGTPFRLDSAMAGAPPAAERQLRLAAALTRDSTFNAVFLPTLARHLHATGGALVGVELAAERPAIRMPEYTRAAVRFFDPFLAPDGAIGGTHICTALNGIRELRPAPSLALQALAYAAVSPEVQQQGRWRFGRDFQRAQRLMTSLALSDAPPQRLERAKGVMWGVMGASDSLQVVLREAYQNYATVLPFVLKD